MANAVIYARYSSSRQREASIEDQERVCREYARQNGDKVVRVYADKAKSGTDAERRPQFQRMVADAKSGRWATVYVYTLDRFARNRYDAATYRMRLKRCGVTVVSAMEPVAEGPEGILMVSLLEGMAEYYSAKLSVNIRRGLEGNALKCRHNGVKVYGYDLGGDGAYLVNEHEAAMVRRAFAMYDAGSSTGDIAEAMEAERTKRGNRWTKSRVAFMLRNEKYAGVYSFGDVRVEGGMPAIVDRETFDRVNERIGRPKSGHGYDYPLSGRLFDGQGRRYIGTCAKGKAGKIYRYYWVQGTARRYPQAQVEGAVERAVADFLASDAAMCQALADAVVQGYQVALENELALTEDLRRRLRDLDAELDRLLDFATSVGKTDHLVAKYKAAGAERAAVAEELADAEEGLPVITRDMVLAYLDDIMACNAPSEVVRAFVTRVVLDGDTLSVQFAVAPIDSANPAQTAGQDGCSRQYALVDKTGRHSNTIRVLAGPFGVVIVTRWP